MQNEGVFDFKFPMLFSGIADVCEWYDDAEQVFFKISVSVSNKTWGKGCLDTKELSRWSTFLSQAWSKFQKMYYPLEKKSEHEFCAFKC
jgi:hypothetical protein